MLPGHQSEVMSNIAEMVLYYCLLWCSFNYKMALPIRYQAFKMITSKMMEIEECIQEKNQN